MKIGIVGPGAMGTFLGGVLGRENEVVVLGRREVKKEEIKIIGKTELNSKVKYTIDPSDLSQVDLVIISTKAFDTEQAVKGIVNKTPSRTYVLSLQNGLDNEEIIARYFGEERTIGGITSHGVTYLDTGEVKHAGKGETVIGPYPEGDNASEIMKELEKVFGEAGISVKKSENILGHIWKKVIINVGINPITALLQVRNGFLVEDVCLTELMRDAVKEAVKVAEEYTVLPSDDLFQNTLAVAENTAENKSSMLQDVMNKRKTEIDHITGAVIEKAEEKGLEVPINRTMYRLIKGKENSYL